MRRGKRITTIDLPLEDPTIEVIYIPTEPVEQPIPVEWPVSPEYTPIQAPTQPAEPERKQNDIRHFQNHP